MAGCDLSATGNLTPCAWHFPLLPYCLRTWAVQGWQQPMCYTIFTAPTDSYAVLLRGWYDSQRGCSSSVKLAFCCMHVAQQSQCISHPATALHNILEAHGDLLSGEYDASIVFLTAWQCK